MHKIALIHPYFGKFPSYFNIFLKSCEYNSTVDFIFFTDCEIPEKHPSNVIFYKFKLEDFNRLASEKNKLNISLNNPFLLCDMKVSYGFVFEDYLKEYDFWGHADIDLIYGNIRNFITDDLLNNYDTIFAKNEYVSGFFALYKNEFKVNHLFQKSKDYKMIFTTNKHYSFGECNFKWNDLKAGKSILELNSEIESFTEVVKKEEKNNYIKSYFKTLAYEFIPNNNQLVSWEKGILKIGSTEIMIFHLVSAKNRRQFIIPKWKKVPELFFVNQFGFYKAKDFNGIRYHLSTLKKQLKVLMKINSNDFKKLFSKF